jgi:hypothetical protein
MKLSDSSSSRSRAVCAVVVSVLCGAAVAFVGCGAEPELVPRSAPAPLPLLDAGPPKEPQSPPDAEAKAAPHDAGVRPWRIVRFGIDGGRGVSDIAVDGSGQYWILPERNPDGGEGPERWIVPIHVPEDGGAPTLSLTGAIHFAREAGPLDTEALAAIDGGFLVGTEQQQARPAPFEEIDRVGLEGGSSPSWARVNLKLWGRTPSKNHGIEGMCIADGRVIAVVEPASDYDGGKAGRTSPLAVYRLSDAKLLSNKNDVLRHVESKSRFSAITCCPAADAGVHIFALEAQGGRNPSFHRIRQFTLSAANELSTDPDLIDIDALYEAAYGDAAVPNLEGIARWNGGFVLVSDNDDGTLDAAGTIVLELTPSPDAGFRDECLQR